MKQFTEERNPFIAREEFLLNRIVQRQGAAPPWIEIQQGTSLPLMCLHSSPDRHSELELAVANFRDVLRQSWTRRAIRMLTLSRPATALSQLTHDQVSAFRDAEWEAREKAYHVTAVEELNSLVRKYNGLAPAAVRRGHYALDVELEKAYKDSAEEILNGIAERVKSGTAGRSRAASASWDEDRSPTQPSGDNSWSPVRIRDVIREWFVRLVSR